MKNQSRQIVCMLFCISGKQNCTHDAIRYFISIKFSKTIECCDCYEGFLCFAGGMSAELLHTGPGFATVMRMTASYKCCSICINLRKKFLQRVRNFFVPGLLGEWINLCSAFCKRQGIIAFWVFIRIFFQIELSDGIWGKRFRR